MKGLGFLIKFSYRNLFRNPKRTLLMVLSLGIGTGFIIWDLNFAKSGSRELMKEFLSQYAGQYHITHNEYYGAKDKKEFNNYKTISDEEITDKSIFEKSSPRATIPAFISGEKKTLGLLLTGIDAKKELSLSKIHHGITVGRFLDPSNKNEIILGRKLAERIEVQIGNQVGVIGQALDGSVANDLFTVVGFFDFGGGDFDESLAFTQLASAQELLAIDTSQYHQRISFDVNNEEIPKISGLAVTKWTDILPEIWVSVRFIDSFTWIACIIIVMVVSLGLTNTLIITFLEREHEFQSLNIIGARTKWITVSLFIEVFIMGTVAVILGVVIGWLATKYFYYNPINIEFFTGGKPILMGGIALKPIVRLYSVPQYYWQVPLLIYGFLTLTMIFPIIKFIRRSSNAV